MNLEQWQPTASLRTLQQRAQLINTIRRFFAARKVLEVFTPVVVKCGVTDPHLDSFALATAASYLRTSPEYAMKRLLAAASGDIYELGPVFRQGESGRWHNPEFHMLEWYRVGWSYTRLIDEVIELLAACSADKLALWPVQKISYADLSRQVLGQELATLPDAHCLELARSHGWHAQADKTSRSVLLDFIFSHLLQPALPRQTLTVIYDFPVCQAALARIRNNPEAPPVAERFEVFLGQLELANGYQELTDANEQLQRFIEDQRQRDKLDRPALEPDRKLLAAMRHGMPECSGVALGVERLLSVMLDAGNVADSMSFDWNRR